MNGSPLRKGEAPAGYGRHAGWILLVLFLLAAVACAVVLLKHRRPPQTAAPEVSVPLVTVRQLDSRDIRVIVCGRGVVRPAVQVAIMPEVPGRIVFVHSQLRAGGVIRAGERILQVDPSSYELAARQARAAVDEAQARLEIEQAQTEMYRQEKRQVNPETAQAQSLGPVLAESRVRQARSAVESAKAELALAELQLGRTSVLLPFDVLVMDETADLGQYVGVGQSLGAAYGIEAFEIEVPIRTEELAWFHAFGGIRASDRDPTVRTTAEIKATFADGEHTWQGAVMGTTGRVDGAAGTIPVVVEVPRPLDASSDRPAMLPGTPVEVFISGKMLENAVAVPRKAVHDGNKVWLVRDNRLERRELDIVRADKDFVYTVTPLPEGVVVGGLDGAAEGLEVRTRLDESK